MSTAGQFGSDDQGPPAIVRLWRNLTGLVSSMMPKGLYARALLIVLVPFILLEPILAFIFMERHWESVTRRLSEATARDVGALVDFYESYPHDDNYRRLLELARERFSLSVQILPPGELPQVRAPAFFALLDRTLTGELKRQLKQPVWIDTLGQSRHVEIRVRLDNAIMRIVATRSQTYASNSHIFLIWMLGTSAVLLTVAVLFMRNQIRPILRLAEAADAFGKGRPVPDDFRPRGAREVRQAAVAFIEMRERIKQHVDQRTTMLAGVSHDLRTILTRFKLELAMLGEGKAVEDLRADVDEMQGMLEDYLAFAKGDGGEEAVATPVRELLEDIRKSAQHFGVPIELNVGRRLHDLVLPLKRNAFKRAITNIVTNAIRFADDAVVIGAALERDWVRIEVEDDGPGIPPAEREAVFKPFYRIDHARNQNEGNTGLGLAITRDIVRGHGGDIFLDTSRFGGLKAVVRIPV